MLKRGYQGIFHKTHPKAPGSPTSPSLLAVTARLLDTRHYGWHDRWDGGQEDSLQGVVGSLTVGECGSLISGTSALAEIRLIG